VPWYFTGEEWIASPKGGMSIAINALTGRVIETPQFGSLNHENVVPIKKMSKAAMFLSEDSFRLRSQAYSYFADDFQDAIRGRGAFTVWVPDDLGDGDPSADDIAKGETMTGRFVTIPHAEHFTGLQLNEVAEGLGSFNFVRIEDAATDPSNPGVVYFADTGANKKTENRYGRIYRMTYDPAHPRRADLEVVLDNGAGDDLMNPDGLGLNETSLVIQEDKNSAKTGYARILVYDLGSETLTAVARTDPSARAIAEAGGTGVWESSGAVDVSDFFGDGMWLVSVQAHKTRIRQQGIDLKIDSAVGERGQLLLVEIPGT
jgi:secreted PhoX family phosphatase